MASGAFAQSRLIPFQARITDSSGTPVADGTYGVTFQIYDAPTGGTALWVEPHSNLAIVGGVLNVFLGSIASLDDPNGDSNPSDSIDFSATSGGRYVGVRVGNGSEMVPRHQLVPAFHARRADITENAAHAGTSDIALIAQSVQPGSITIPALAPTFSLPGGSIAANSITGSQLSIVDAEGITSQNIKNGSIALTDLDSSLQTAIGTDRIFTTETFVANGTFVVPPDCSWLSVLASGGGEAEAEAEVQPEAAPAEEEAEEDRAFSPRRQSFRRRPGVASSSRSAREEPKARWGWALPAEMEAPEGIRPSSVRAFH